MLYLGREDLREGIPYGDVMREIEQQKKRQEEPLPIRLSKLPKSIIGGMRPNPERLALVLLVLLGGGVALNLGRQVIEGQTRIAAITASANERPDRVPSIGSSGDEPKLDIIPPRPDDLIRQYIEDRINNNLVGRAEKFDKLWNITITEPVQIKIIAEGGVNLRDFPDPGIGQKMDALPYDAQKPLPGLYQYFSVIKDPKTQDLSIWANRWKADENGQIQLQTFAVYFGREWYAVFITEESAALGTAMPPEKLFEQAYPPVQLPKIASIAL